MSIPITIRPLFWLLAAFIGWMSTFTLTGTLIAMLVILISVLFHEFGHALTASCFHQKVRIELAAFGGFTYREGRRLKLGEEFLVVLNGPLAGLLLGFLAWITYRNVTITNPSLLFALQFTALANFFWTVINLIPLLPLDGGHLLSIILEALFGFRGVKLAVFIGLAIGLTLSIFFLVTGSFILGLLFLVLTFESFRSLRYYKQLTENDRDENLQQQLREAEKDLEQKNIEGALTKFEEVRKRTGKGVLFTLATQEMARIYHHENDNPKAYALLYPLRKKLNPTLLPLFHQIAFATQNYRTVTEISDTTFQQSPTPTTALNNALAFAALNQTEPALGWLECALREGLPSPRTALDNPLFNPLRTDPRFLEIHNRI